MYVMLKAIIFDFDGTVADTMQNALRVYNEHAKSMNLPKITDPERLRGKHAKEVLIKELGIPIWKLPKMVYLGKKILKEAVHDVDLFPGIKDVIDQLRGEYQVGILTSNKKEVVQRVFAKHGLEVDFIYSDFSFFYKQIALWKILRKYKWQRHEVIYVGDEMRDVESCKKAGIKIIGVSWGYNTAQSLRNVGADFVAESVDDIKKIIEQKPL